MSIRSTHVGSLIRPASLLAFEAAIERGESYDEAAYAETLKAEVADVVRRQADCGIDIVSDGEFGKANWIAYLYNRISGVGPRELGPEDSFLPPSRDRQAFPGTYAQHDKEMFRAFAENERRVAGMVVEPAMMNCGVVLPQPGYLQGLLDLCHRNGAYLAFDEVKTGCTIAWGGAVEAFGRPPSPHDCHGCCQTERAPPPRTGDNALTCGNSVGLTGFEPATP